MATLARRLAPFGAWLFTHRRTRDARRFLHEQRRRLSGAPHRVHYFHQVDDPYSQLAAQVLPELLARYDVVLDPHLVGPPPDEAAPERARLEAYARKDAADVAPAYGLDFPRTSQPPAPEAARRAAQLLTAALEAGRFPEEAARVGAALWRGDAAALEQLAKERAPASEEAARRAVAAGTALRRRLGHYSGAMLHYGGEWYWGVDRLWHLERRLQALGRLRPGASAAPIAPRPDDRDAPPLHSERRLRLEFYPSLRSPYTAIAMRRVLALPRRYPLELLLRPVLPMVMRGLPVPGTKRLYIVLDTKREAEDAGEPFGRTCDPVGRPVEQAFSLYPFACSQGRGAEFLAAFTRAAFAEGVDTGSPPGLRHVVEQAGLRWEEAQQHLGASGWQDELEENRRQLFALGLWGVPSFRLLGDGGEPDFCTWGQDRIWRVEREIRRRLGRPVD